MPAVIKSLLKEAMETFPKKQTIKGSAVKGMLTKKGVKPEEIKFAELGIEQEKRYTPEELIKLESGRKDVFETHTQPQGGFDWVSLHDQATNPTYKEKVITFKQGPKQTKVEVKVPIKSENALRHAESLIGEDNPDTAMDILAEEFGLTRAQGYIDRIMNDDVTSEQFIKELQGPSRYTSEHFADQPDYLMHTRSFDETIDGVPTRVLQEIQSDLHQQGRQVGYDNPLTSKERKLIEDYQEIFWDEEKAIAAGYKDAEDLTVQAEKVGEVRGIDLNSDDVPYQLQRLLEDTKSNIPESPYQKTWLRKGIEREVVDAINEGRQQLAIPIKGTQVGQKLQRAEGVQKWYETQVVNTAKKVAKSAGADFELKTTSTGKMVDAFTPKERAQLTTFLTDLKAYPAARQAEVLDETMANPRMRSNPAIIAILDNIKQGLIRPSEALAQLSKLQLPESMTYAIIKPKGKAIPSGKQKLSNEMAIIEEELQALELQGMGPGNTRFNEVFNRKKALQMPKDKMADTTFKAEPVSFSLYSTPIAGAFAGYQALRQGYSDQEITDKLAAEDHDADEITEMLSKAKMIQAAIAQGHSEEGIKQFLLQEQPREANVETLDTISIARAQEILGQKQEAPSIFSPWSLSYDLPEHLVTEARDKLLARREETREGLLGMFVTEGPLPPGFAEAEVLHSLAAKVNGYKAIIDTDIEMTLEDFTANLEVIAPNMSSIFTRTSGWVGNYDASVTAAKAEEASRTRIVKLAKDAGVNLVWKDPREEDAPANLGLLWEPGEWVAVLKDGTELPANPGFWASLESEQAELTLAVLGGIGGAKVGTKVPGPWWAKALGGLAASIAGAATGSATGSQYDYISSSIQLQQEMSSSVAAHRALTAAEASIIGDVIAYPIAKTIGYGWKGIVQAKNYIMAGNKGGAKIALKETMLLSDDEVDYIVEQLSRVSNVPGEGSDKGIAAFMATQPGGETVMKVAGSIDATATRAVVKGIDNRAKDLETTALSITDENVGRLVKQDLANYEADVKGFYGNVKSQAANTPNMNKWSFDYAKLGINPVLEAMEKQIADVPALERFVRRSELIRARADGRTFADLLDLRQMVNEFRFGRGNKKAIELDVFINLRKQIDVAINQGAEVVIENPKQWLSDWSLARSRYAKMKELQKNVLFRAINRKGINEKSVVQGMTRYITALDETWTDVMAQLPMAAKGKMEGAVINALTNKFTVGSKDGLQAVNFPMLSDELAKTTFTTPDARKLKGAIERLAEVFKNDVPLAQHTGNISIPKDQSYLTTDPVVRLQYEFASSIFNRVKKMMPTKKGRSLALIMRTADLLENPLNVKSAKALMDEVGDEMNLAPEILKLQRAAANKASTQSSALVKLYGEGKILSPKGTGKETKIQVTRIATPDVIKTIMEAEGIAKSDSKALEHALKSRGYQAFMLGSEKVKLL